MFPSLKEFKKLSDSGNLVPVWEEVLGDFDTPVGAYLKVQEVPSFLLESVEGGEKWGRYSIIGTSIRWTLTAKDRTVTLKERGKTIWTRRYKDPMDAITRFMDRFNPSIPEGAPGFIGGLVGFVGYEAVRFFERGPYRQKPDPGYPDYFFMVPEVVIIFDNLKHTIQILCPVLVDEDPDKAYASAKKRIEETIEKLKNPVALPERPSGCSKKDTASFRSTFGTRKAFEEAVRRCKDYVYRGDVVQVVLSQRFDRPCTVHPFSLYRALRVINPSPYMFYLDTGQYQMAGSSPEILVKLAGKKITLRPIAGTRPRGKSEAEDLALERQLRQDPKEQAEHIMLVDLGRNDVGRVAEIGSVKVTELMVVERYSHVMHLVSNVEGTLKEGLTGVDLFRATFPAGTVTGAPKVRAMEIIDELEPERRGPYAGALGYFGFTGNMDFCITIRTLFVKDGKVSVQAGAGIVADSVPQREYTETVNKARAMMKAVDMAESM
ncbi:MAG: anthranilate synthase component I [Nitrospirae bacterium]|nr:MAG: anthranilate synthase component I [Nitrospirota bacterium]